MRTEDILGYITFAIAGYFYYTEGYGTSKTGLFFNSMAIGFFLASVFKQFKKLRDKDK